MHTRLRPWLLRPAVPSTGLRRACGPCRPVSPVRPHAPPGCLGRSLHRPPPGRPIFSQSFPVWRPLRRRPCPVVASPRRSPRRQPPARPLGQRHLCRAGLGIGAGLAARRPCPARSARHADRRPGEDVTADANPRLPASFPAGPAAAPTPTASVLLTGWGNPLALIYPTATWRGEFQRG